MSLDLKTFKWPKISGLDLAFPTVGADERLLAEAHARGFIHGDTEFERLFSTLFFKGGKLDFRG